MPDPAVPPLVGRMPSEPTPDAVYDAFEEWASAQGLNLYPAQTEALIELVDDANVILATPTGSGKSLVAAGAHFAALAHGRRSYYTAPIKALVSEKFFALCDMFGADNVGMLTGDAAVNPTRRSSPHRRGARQRRAARGRRRRHRPGRDGRVPLLRRPGPRLGMAGAAARADRAQFLLMSATLGDMSRFRTTWPAGPVDRRRWCVGRATGPVALLLRHHADPRDAGGAADDAPGAGLRRPLHPGRGDRAGAGAVEPEGRDPRGARPDRGADRRLPVHRRVRQDA